MKIIEYNFFWTILNGRKKMWWLFFSLQTGKPSSATILVFPVVYQLQKAFGKFVWKVNRTRLFGSFQLKISFQQRKIRKGSPVLTDGMFKVEIPTACSLSSKQERIKLSTLRFKAIFDTCKGKWFIHDSIIKFASPDFCLPQLPKL